MRRTDMRQLWTMTASDLRQRVRDKSVVIFGLVVPLALMFVFNLTIGSTNDIALKPLTIAASVPADDALAATLVTALTQVDSFAITVDKVSADEAGARVRSAKAQLAVVVPDGFGDAVMQGRAAVVDVTEGYGSGIEGDIALSVMQGVLDHLSASAVVVNACLQSGVARHRLGALAEQAATATPTVRLTEGNAST